MRMTASPKPRLFRLAAANARSKLAESLYVRTGLDFTRPVQVYATVNTRCVARCRMCDFWRRKPQAELPAGIWVRALRSLRRFAGQFHVQFCAAEPLLKEDIFDILRACDRMGLTAGITTNGLLLNDANVGRIIDANLFNVNISIDSMDESVHDSIRGVPGLLGKVKANIDRLLAARARAGSGLRIVLRPLICAETVAGAHRIVEYAAAKGLTGVHFQPIELWTDETKEMFQVDPDRLARAQQRLIDMKAAGWPVMNSPDAIRRWTRHFLSQPAANEAPCASALRNVNIAAGGDVSLCSMCDSVVGNIRTGDLGAIWRSVRARQMRRQLVRCTRICNGTAVEKRNWRAYLDLFRRLAG